MTPAKTPRPLPALVVMGRWLRQPTKVELATAVIGASSIRPVTARGPRGFTLCGSSEFPR